MRSRYNLCQPVSFVENGVQYPDILTYPIEKFRYKNPLSKYTLNLGDIKRPDLLVYRLYGLTEFDDIVCNLNGVYSLLDMEAGDEILIPTKSDLETFFRENLV